MWTEIRRRHPDVPAVIVTVGAGSIGARPGALRLGHYAHARWRPATPAGEAPAMAELFIGGEGLAHGPVNVLGTLLHEATHGVAATRGIKDTSRAGAYHNKRFRALGEELGLQLDRHPTIGWLTTTVPDPTAAAYVDQVEQLRAAIVHVRESEHQARRAGPATPPDGEGTDDDTTADPGAGTRSAPTYLCGCEPPRRLRMAPTVYALADVLCRACGQPFTADCPRRPAPWGGEGGELRRRDA